MTLPSALSTYRRCLVGIIVLVPVGLVLVLASLVLVLVLEGLVLVLAQTVLINITAY